MRPEPEVLSLDPTTLGEVIADIRRLGEAAHAPEEAAASCSTTLERPARRDRRRGRRRRAAPRVLALEWLDPPYIGGHWVPQMIEHRRRRSTCSASRARSRATVEWDEVDGAEARVVVVDAVRLRTPTAPRPRPTQHADRIAALGARPRRRRRRLAYFSRPGPAARRRHRAAGARAPPGSRRRRRPAGPHGRARRDRRCVGMKHAEQQAVIDGTPQECFDALLDYESFPDWQRAVKVGRVLTRDARAAARRWRSRSTPRCATIRYTLRYSLRAAAPDLLGLRRGRREGRRRRVRARGPGRRHDARHLLARARPGRLAAGADPEGADATR